MVTQIEGTEITLNSNTNTSPDLSFEKEFQWMGTLKRSLSYTDESDDTSSAASAASDIEERNRVIIDEIFSKATIRDAERLKIILNEIAADLEALAAGKVMKPSEPQALVIEEEKKESTDLSTQSSTNDADMTASLLLKIRDIIHGRVDLSRVFVAMVGIDFLLGCACEQDTVPRPVRSACLSILVSLCEGIEAWNLTIQYEMLNEERGALKKLAHLFFAEEEKGEDCDGMIRGLIVRTISACLFGHRIAENRFVDNLTGRGVIKSGLGVRRDESSRVTQPPASLRRSSLLFLKNLLLSNSSSDRRVESMRDCLVHVMQNCLTPKTEQEGSIRRMALEMLLNMMRRKVGMHVVLEEGEKLVSMGDERVSEIIALGKDERDAMNYELRLWQRLIGEILSAS